MLVVLFDLREPGDSGCVALIASFASSPLSTTLVVWAGNVAIMNQGFLSLTSRKVGPRVPAFAKGYIFLYISIYLKTIEIISLDCQVLKRILHFQEL